MNGVLRKERAAACAGVALGLAAGLVMLTAVAARAEGAGAITLSADFPNGSVGEWEVTGPDTVKFALTRASGGLWFHFRIDGVKGRTITFVIPMTRDLSKITAHYYDQRNRPAYSYDRENWLLAEPGRLDTEAKTFTFTIAFTEDTAWVAYTTPYTNETLDELLAEYADSPYLRVRKLATTAEGRPVYWLTIAEEPDRKEQGTSHTTWIVARESGWEAPASWAADGLIRFALSEGNLAAQFRRRVILQVVPILAPDAVAGGWMTYPTGDGKQTWLTVAYARNFPEVTALKQAVRSWMESGNTMDFAFRFHSSGWMFNQHHLREELYLPEEQVAFDGLADRLQRFVPQVRWLRQHLYTSEGFIEYCFRNFQTKGGTLSLSLGAKGNQMGKAQLQDVGRALGEVILSLHSPFEVLQPSSPR